MVIANSSEITKDKLLSQCYANVYNFVDSNITDPIGSSSRRMIYTRFPKTTGLTFKGYPFIVVKPTKLLEPQNRSLNGDSEMLMWEIPIEIWSADRSANSSGDPLGLQYLESMSDELVYDINQNLATFRE